MNDDIDDIRSAWHHLRPELDTAVVDVVGRVLRSAALITRRADELLAGFALTRGEFDILAVLRRADAPLSPGALRTISLATGPSTTKRLRSLESRVLVDRSANPDDGRGALIALTPAGIALIDDAFPRLLDLERTLVAGIPEARRPAVVQALREVLESLDSAAP